jgi:hypothetical protein
MGCQDLHLVFTECAGAGQIAVWVLVVVSSFIKGLPSPTVLLEWGVGISRGRLVEGVVGLAGLAQDI